MILYRASSRHAESSEKADNSGHDVKYLRKYERRHISSTVEKELEAK